MDYNNLDPKFHLVLSDDTHKGNYSNLAVISHSSSEFVVDFAQVRPGMVKPEVCDRIILSPEHAKRLLFALQENIGKYEQNFGTIKIPQPAQQSKPIAPFNINKGEA